MTSKFIFAIDLMSAIFAGLAAWIWFLASQRRIRRVSRFEKLDAADINRIVVSINRNQILNSRAALAAACAALLASVRYCLDVFLR